MREPNYRVEASRLSVLAAVQFNDWWPEGVPELVREFLLREYDPETMPPLILNQDADGVLWMVGWDPKLHPLGRSMLEVVRGYGLTRQERAWIFDPVSHLRATARLDGALHRGRTLKALVRAGADG